MAPGNPPAASKSVGLRRRLSLPLAVISKLYQDDWARRPTPRSIDEPGARKRDNLLFQPHPLDKLPEKLGRGFDQRFLTPAECSAPKSGQRLDVILAAVVIDPHAFSALDNQRSGFAQLQEIGVGMKHAFHVARLGVAERHAAQLRESGRD